MTRIRISACAAVILAVLNIATTGAFAYVGPGTALSFLGSLFGMIAAVVVALLAVLYWPIRMLLRRFRKKPAEKSAE